MALTFGAATSDRVDHGSATYLDDLTTFTYAQWVYPTTLTGNRVFMSKTAASSGKFFLLDGAIPSALQLFVNHATTALSYISVTGTMTTGAWQFIAATFDSAGGALNQAHLYRGTTSTAVTEVSYNSRTDGAGAVTADAAANLRVGNTDGLTAAIQGHIAWAGVWNRSLSFAEIQDQQYFPHVTTGNVLFSRYNRNTTGTQYDSSGLQNNGTVTGATVTTIADPTSVVFSKPPKTSNVLKPYPFSPGIAR